MWQRGGSRLLSSRRSSSLILSRGLLLDGGGVRLRRGGTLSRYDRDGSLKRRSFATTVIMKERRAADGLTESQRFEFDLNGFIVLRNVLSREEVERMNDAIDARLDRGEGVPRTSKALRNAGSSDGESYFGAKGDRIDLGGMLTWKGEDGDGFRSILDHDALRPVLRDLVGSKYRLDHDPLVIVQDKDSEGFKLHGGPLMRDDDDANRVMLNPELQYRTRHGAMWNSLVAVSVALCETDGRRDGGLCLLRGSHKASFPVPDAFIDGNDDASSAFLDEHLCVPSTRPGDVVIFSEATTHGSRPWRSEKQRRLALYRFAPRQFAYGRSYFDVPDWSGAVPLCTPSQSSVLRPPYSGRLDDRSEEKIQHDKDTFGHAYF